MKKTLMSVLALVFAFVAMSAMLPAFAVNAEEDLSGCGVFSPNLLSGDFVLEVPACLSQISGSTADPSVSAKQYPRNAAMIVHVYYQGRNANGRKIIGEQALEGKLDIQRKLITCTFLAARLGFSDITSIMVVPKVPGWNKKKGESVFINPDDAYAQGVEGYRFLYDPKTAKVAPAKAR